MAAEAGCDEKTVRRWKDRYGVASRPVSETAALRQARTDELPARTLEVIEGELLGDGSLVSRVRGTTRYAAQYLHHARDRAYLEWLVTQLPGLEHTIFGPYKPETGTAFVLQTRTYAGLLPLFERWYDPARPAHRRKRVPLDLRVTPLMALHWYLGDGHLAVDRRSPGTKPVIRLSTDGFALEEVERLAAQLQHCRARVGRFGKGHRIVLDSAPFLEWIGHCPVPDVYGYKWRPRA
ncbi:hypothetical protein [Streptomyces sp. OE57]|uniref:hypothetical protein n=1 Tax=Streptomyces lacaronensis TaxID=3379885 RepID=UPI0039B793B1